MRYRNATFLITTFFVFVILIPYAAKAQIKATKGTMTNVEVSNKNSRLLLQDIEHRLRSLKKQPAHQPALSQQMTAFMIVDDSKKSVTFPQTFPNGFHYFLTRFILVNQSSQPLKLVRDQVSAKVDGKAHPISGLHKNLRYESVRVGNQNHRLNTLKFEKEVVVPAGKQGSLWIVLAGLPAGPPIPDIELQAVVNGQTFSLNVNRFEFGKLRHKVQLMGPNQCLAELSVSGELNSINIGSLKNEIDELTTQKNVKRFVIHFPNENSTIDSEMKQWLARSAAQIQVGSNTIVRPRFPLFPRMMRELHLSGKVFKDVKAPYTGTRIQVTHETEAAAIHAALDSAMKVLSREKISEQIRSGPPPVKVAALISGGRQLTNEELPLVLKLSTDQNPIIQEAALYALRFFGDPRAFERLGKAANSPPGAQFEMAIASLAESRFSEGQTLLLKILKQHSPESQKVIIGIIAQSPRPQWGAAIYSFLSSENLDLRKAAIKALVLNGHPKLLEVLTDSLNSPNPELREVAFQELVKQSDSESESRAMKYILVQLQHQVPSKLMLNFIDRLKDPRSIPLLSLHLQNPKLNVSTRTSIIKTLASIGDQSVAEEFLKFYPKASASEKLLILGSLQRVRSPHYYKLASQAIQDKNLSIVNGTVSSLRASGSNEALVILQKALQSADKSSTWNSIFSALVSFGTPEARQTIMQARQLGKNREKQKAAHSALANMYQRSPGNHYCKLGQQQQSRKQWKTAIANYETAISIDSLLVPAYLGIVNAKNSLKQYDEALRYADLGLNIDRMHPRLHAAKGLIFSNQSKKTEALKHFHKAIELAPQDTFPYIILASHYAKYQQYKEALQTYDRAIKVNPHYMNTYDFKAELLLKMQKLEEAIKTYDSAIAVNKGHTRAYTKKIELLRKGKRYQQALAVCDDILKIDTKSIYALLTKASILQDLSRTDDAIAACDAAIEIKPDDLQSYFKKIELLRKGKRYQQALAVCDDILKIDTKSIYALLTKAYIFRELSQTDAAIAACDAAIKIDPGFINSYITKAQIYNEAERWNEAINVYDQIISKDEKNLNAFTGRGHSNLQKKDWKAAQKDFQKAFDLNSKSTQAISGLGICMVYNHEEDKAIPFVEGYVKQFEKNGLFRYNVACVFGRALINLNDQPKTPDLLKRAQSYQTKALAHLSVATQNGFEDVEWMLKDPDLAALQSLPGFKTLVLTMQKKSNAINE